MKPSQNIVAILAGGVGSRVGGEMPKQFLMLGGKRVIEHTVEAFERHPMIDAIVVVMHPDYLATMEALVEQNGWQKVKGVFPGGSQRVDSTLSALQGCEWADNEDRILIHDAARPLVSSRIITDVVTALDAYEAVAVGVPATDTLWMVSDKGEIESIPDRSLMRCAQTPQAFRMGLIREACRRALEDPRLKATDDCGVVVRYVPEVKIHVVEGDIENVKITYPKDINQIEQYLL